MADVSKQLRVMRKFFILFLALLPSLAWAQKVILNERNEKGIRYIETDMRAFYVDHNMHMCNLSYIEQNGEGFYGLLFCINEQDSRWTAKIGQPLLLKDTEGNITTIKASGESQYKLTSSVRGNGVVYMVYLPYTLTEEEAEIFAKGLVKIRIEYTYENGRTNMMDINIPDDLTNYLRKAHKNISKTIPLPVEVDKSVF